MREEKVALLAGAFALAMILGALFFQYVRGVLPCEVCHWQRWPHDGAIVVGLGAALLYHFRIIDRSSVRLLAWLTLLLILASAAIGGYQAGFEWHWWHGPSSCTGPRFQLSAHMDLNAPVVSCENPSWRLFGLSLAGYNFLISGGAALLGALLLLRVIKLPFKWANS